MKLSIIDRTIIYYSMLPETGTIEGLKISRSIKGKIGLTEEESDTICVAKDYSNMITLDIKDLTALDRDKNFEFTLEETNFLKVMAENLNAAGRVTEYSMETIEMLINYTSE